MQTSEIRDLVRRLARPHGKDSVIVEGVAIRAEGSDFDAVEEWILANGGKPEAVEKRRPSGGLHGGRFAASDANRNLGTTRYTLPASALEAPAEEAGEESADEDHTTG